MSRRSMPGHPSRRRVFLGKSQRSRSKTAPSFSPRPAAGQRIAAHPDAAILVAVASAGKFITGGDDGRVVAVSPDGTPLEIANEKGKWIDALAARGDGAIAWSCGKNVRARDPSGGIKTFAAPSSVRGLAFMPKGYRIAIAHYDGATLWFPNAAAPPDLFKWKGSHLSITVVPGRAFSRDRDAGKHAAWLARRRQEGHAHERLSRENALAVLVLRWPMAGDVWCRCRDRLAVQG